MAVRMPYREFERTYLSQAASLTQGEIDPEAAAKLCKKTYQLMDGQKMSNCREVFVRLAEVYYDNLTKDGVDEVALVIERVYGSGFLIANQHCCSLDECLDSLTFVLCELALHDRIIGALRLLGWTYQAIADLFNTTLSEFCEELQREVTLTEAHSLLSTLRKKFSDQLCYLDNNHLWLCSLITEEGDAVVEASALRVIREIGAREEAYRFARSGNVERDRHGWLRDRWRCVRKSIRKNIEPSNLFQRKANEVGYDS